MSARDVTQSVGTDVILTLYRHTTWVFCRRWWPLSADCCFLLLAAAAGCSPAAELLIAGHAGSDADGGRDQSLHFRDCSLAGPTHACAVAVCSELTERSAASPAAHGDGRPHRAVITV